MDKKESNNYLKLAFIVVEIVADALRAVFKTEWDSLYPPMVWNDDPASLANFKAKAKPFGPPKKNIAWNSYNSLTNGDRKTWDITKLCYVLIYSKPLNLRGNKPLIYGAVDTLRQIRNDVLHKEKAEILDADFKTIYKDVKTELTKFGATCHYHINEVKTIKSKALPKDVIEKLEKERDKARREFIDQRKRQKKHMIYSFGLIVCLILLIGALIHYFVPPKVPSYFPDTTLDVVGRQAEIDSSTDALLSGIRLISLHGSQGIGKRTIAFAVGKKLIAKWIPFPWISIAYVNLHGVKDISTLQRRILESFFIFTESDVSFRLKEFVTNIIKRQTIVIFDRLQELFESEIKYEAKEFIIDMLDWNQNIAFVLINSKPVETAKYEVKAVGLKPLSESDSVLLLRATAGKDTDIIEKAIVNVSQGIPILLKLYGKVIKHNKLIQGNTPIELIETVQMNTHGVANDEQTIKCVTALIDRLSESHQEILIFMSLSLDSVSLNTISDIFPDSEETVTELLDMDLLEAVGVREQNVRYSAIVHGLCETVISERLRLCKESEAIFLKHFVSVATRLGSALFEKNLKTENILPMLIEEEQNIKVMFEIGRKYSYISYTFFEMLVTTSVYFTLGLPQTAFTRYVYYASALIFKDVDTSKFLSLLYAQSDRGDIYSFNHPDDFVIAYKLINESVELFEKEPVCRSNMSSRENGICFLVYGRVIGLNLTAVMKSKRFEIVYNPERGLALVEMAIDIFSRLKMKHDLAEALSCRGLILMTLGNFTQSLPAYEKSLNIMKEIYYDHPFVAASYFNTAYLYYKMGGFYLLKAKALFDSSYSMFSRTIGSHRRTVNALFYMGTSLQYIGKYDESKVVISKAYKIQVKIMTLHTDLTKAPRDKAESLIMYNLVEQANPTAERQLEMWSITKEVSLKSSFIAYFIANCQKSVGNVEAAFESYSVTEHKLSRICQNDTDVCEFYSMVKDDITRLKGANRNAVQGMTKNDVYSDLTALTEMIGLVVYFVCYAGIILLLSVLFLYICLFRNADFFYAF